MHLDLKPDNVLIKNRVVKICDFGISKFLNSRDPVVVDYGFFPKDVMIPEVINKEPLGFASDSFQLGAILYFLCTFEMPSRKHEDILNNPYDLSKIPKTYSDVTVWFIKELWVVKLADRKTIRDLLPEME